jgi:drug/metabolite transporter (DMT)-like permease
MTSAALVTAIISISFASIFIRWSEAPAEVIAAYRMGFAALIILPLVLRQGNRREVRNLRPRQWLAVMVVGAILALHFLTFNAALEATSVASATVLITCHPLVVGILGYVFLKELPRRSGLGVALGISGVLVISSADLTGGAINGEIGRASCRERVCQYV